MLNGKQKVRTFASYFPSFSSPFTFYFYAHYSLVNPRINLYSAHNDLLPFIIIESFKARSGFFVPIKPGFVSPIKPELMTFPRFPSLSFSENRLRIFDESSRVFVLRERKELSTDAVICWTKWKKYEIYENTNLERSHRAFQSLSENAACKSEIRTRLTAEYSTKRKKRKASRVTIIFIIKYRTLP